MNLQIIFETAVMRGMHAPEMFPMEFISATTVPADEGATSYTDAYAPELRAAAIPCEASRQPTMATTGHPERASYK